jgi:PcfJ-like protein
VKKKQRVELRERADARKQSAREDVRAAKERSAERLEAALNILQTRDVLWEDRHIANLPEGGRALVRSLMDGPRIGRKLVEGVTRGAVVRLGGVPSVRPIETWSPRGKGRDSVFRSLCEHLTSKYPTPPFLWSAFDDAENAERLVPLVVHVAQGGSLFQFCKNGGLPFALTRAQCAEFMQSEAAFDVLSALRRVQVKTEGGDRRLFEVWRRLPTTRTLQTPALEAFGITVLRFLARNPFLNQAQIAPLCDYVYHRNRREPGFAMQGRTANALLRDMAAWHQELNTVRAEAKYTPVAFERSGFKSHRVEREAQGPVGKKGYSGQPQIWSITEILHSTDLQAEGRALHHCVSSYRWQIEAKQTSIWSLSATDEGMNTEKLATLEVNNRLSAVVQARGRYNRLTTAQEDKVVIAWALKNGLSVQYGKRW